VIRVAARTGYDRVGLRLIAVTDDTPGYRLMDDKTALQATNAAVNETGVGVLDIEFVKITPELDVAGLESFVAAGAELGARYVITAPYDPDLSRLADRLARIGDLCGQYGLRAVLEFFPWTVVPDLDSALRALDAARHAQVGVLVDTLHFNRSRSSIEQLRGIAPERLPFLHVSDAKVRSAYTNQELLHAGRSERLPPGEGEIDLLEIIRAMPADAPVALEIPMTRLTAQVGPEAVARRVREAARAALGF
jgi:sugar phosphate isomerase/epimerase